LPSCKVRGLSSTLNIAGGCAECTLPAANLTWDLPCQIRSARTSNIHRANTSVGKTLGLI
jgi:hypothetical protein